MLNWKPRSTHSTQRVVLVVLLSVGMFYTASPNAIAQEPGQSSFLASIAKQVALDPTTYAPAVIAYDATVRDWNSSQPFFRHGYMEFNERFTITGLPNSTPVSYDIGYRRIVSDAFGNLGMSIVNNAADRIFEHAL